MRIAIFVVIATLISGCASTYKQSNLTEPAAKLLKGKSVVIATPTNGSYGNTGHSRTSQKPHARQERSFFQMPNTLCSHKSRWFGLQ